MRRVTPVHTRQDANSPRAARPPGFGLVPTPGLFPCRVPRFTELKDELLWDGTARQPLSWGDRREMRGTAIQATAPIFQVCFQRRYITLSSLKTNLIFKSAPKNPPEAATPNVLGTNDNYLLSGKLLISTSYSLLPSK